MYRHANCAALIGERARHRRLHQADICLAESVPESSSRGPGTFPYRDHKAHRSPAPQIRCLRVTQRSRTNFEGSPVAYGTGKSLHVRERLRSVDAERLELTSERFNLQIARQDAFIAFRTRLGAIALQPMHLWRCRWLVPICQLARRHQRQNFSRSSSDRSTFQSR